VSVLAALRINARGIWRPSRCPMTHDVLLRTCCRCSRKARPASSVSLPCVCVPACVGACRPLAALALLAPLGGPFLCCRGACLLALPAAACKAQDDSASSQVLHF
jgi:hypothetical protein